MRLLTLSADDRGTGLRFDNELDDIEPISLGLSERTICEIKRWQRGYLDYYDLNEQQWRSAISLITQHEVAGIHIARQVQTELGGGYHVSFYSQIKRGRIDS